MFWIFPLILIIEKYINFKLFFVFSTLLVHTTIPLINCFSYLNHHWLQYCILLQPPPSKILLEKWRVFWNDQLVLNVFASGFVVFYNLKIMELCTSQISSSSSFNNLSISSISSNSNSLKIEVEAMINYNKKIFCKYTIKSINWNYLSK